MSRRFGSVVFDIKKVTIILFALTLVSLAYIVDKAGNTERVKKVVAYAPPATQAAENEIAKR